MYCQSFPVQRIPCLIFAGWTLSCNLIARWSSRRASVIPLAAKQARKSILSVHLIITELILNSCSENN